MRLSFFVLTAVILFSTSCKDEEVIEDFDKMVFHFQDRSVEPEYQNSHKITITAKGGKTTVERIGRDPEEIKLELGKNSFNRLKSMMQKVGKESGVENKDDCDGCWTKTITLYKGKKKIYHLKWTGGEPSSELQSAIDYMYENVESSK
jgi:hypothetical protein